MTPRSRRSLLVLLTIGVVACAPTSSAPSPTAHTASAIQGGEADTTHTFVVAVLDEAFETCSGTLIAPNLVLTARHCISNDSGGAFVDCTTDEFTETADPGLYRVTTASRARFNEAPYGVAKILTPKSAKFCGNDIALLILETSIPSSEATPAAPALDPNNADYGTELTAIGYGTTAPGGNDQRTRRRRDEIPIVCLPNDGSGCDPTDFDITAAELAAGDGLCEGDSGSGAFVPASLTSTPEVIGVLSRASDDGESCIDAIYTRTDAFSVFLVAGAVEAAQAGGYAVPKWAAPKDEEPTEGEDASVSTPVDRVPDASDTGEAPAQTTAAPVADTGCTVTPGASSSGTSFAVLALGLLAARRRRR